MASGQPAKPDSSLVEEILKANDKDAVAHLLKGQVCSLRENAREVYKIRQAATNLFFADAQIALGKMSRRAATSRLQQQAGFETCGLTRRAAAERVLRGGPKQTT